MHKIYSFNDYVTTSLNEGAGSPAAIRSINNIAKTLKELGLDVMFVPGEGFDIQANDGLPMELDIANRRGKWEVRVTRDMDRLQPNTPEYKKVKAHASRLENVISDINRQNNFANFTVDLDDLNF